MPSLVPPQQDEFKPTGNSYELPPDLDSLDPLNRQRVAICSLFAHQNVPVRNIARIMGVEYGYTVKTLLEAGLVQERRKNLQRPQIEEPTHFQES
jgi:hypothetical protein